MKRWRKALLSVVLVVVAVFSVTSCGDAFGPASSGTSSSTVSVSGVNFKVEYSATESEPAALVDVLKRIRSSVVEIYVQTDKGTGSGSGVVISIDKKTNAAIIVTCHHVLEGSKKMVVKAVDGTEFDNVALVGSDPKSDIGVITIVGEGVSGLSTAVWYSPESTNSDYIDVGTEVVAIGNPLGVLGGTVTKGIISAVNREVNVEGKAAINGGNSGGGLFNAQTGRLVGIVNAGYKSSSAQGLSFAIAGNTAYAKFQALTETYKANEQFGYIKGNFDLGVEFGLYQSFYFRKQYVGISSLDQYGLFAKNDLRVEDLISSIKIGDNEEFTVGSATSETLTNLNNYIAKAKFGDTVTVKYTRGNDNKTAEFTVDQYVYGQSK